MIYSFSVGVCEYCVNTMMMNVVMPPCLVVYAMFANGIIIRKDILSGHSNGARGVASSFVK